MRRASHGQPRYQFPTPQTVGEQTPPPQQQVSQMIFQTKHQQSANFEKPLFVVENFDQPSYSGYSKRASSFLSHGKRKSDSESSFHPLTKQQITEERITSSMQQLSLEMPANQPAVNYQQPSAGCRTADEGFFEDLNDSSSEEDAETESWESDLWIGRNVALTLAPGVKETLRKFEDDVLPRKIIQEMNRSSLALVPYQPPVSDFTLGVNNEKIELVFNKNTTNNNTFSVKAEMDVDVEEDHPKEKMVE